MKMNFIESTKTPSFALLITGFLTFNMMACGDGTPETNEAAKAAESGNFLLGQWRIQKPISKADASKGFSVAISSGYEFTQEEMSLTINCEISGAIARSASGTVKAKVEYESLDTDTIRVKFLSSADDSKEMIIGTSSVKCPVYLQAGGQADFTLYDNGTIRVSDPTAEVILEKGKLEPVANATVSSYSIPNGKYVWAAATFVDGKVLCSETDAEVMETYELIQEKDRFAGELTVKGNEIRFVNYTVGFKDSAIATIIVDRFEANQFRTMRGQVMGYRISGNILRLNMLGTSLNSTDCLVFVKNDGS